MGVYTNFSLTTLTEYKFFILFFLNFITFYSLKVIKLRNLNLELYNFNSDKKLHLVMSLKM